MVFRRFVNDGAPKVRFFTSFDGNGFFASLDLFVRRIYISEWIKQGTYAMDIGRIEILSRTNNNYPKILGMMRLNMFPIRLLAPMIGQLLLLENLL